MRISPLRGDRHRHVRLSREEEAEAVTGSLVAPEERHVSVEV
ncbi:hypothetical protein [Streptomyces sp. NPDC021212]